MLVTELPRETAAGAWSYRDAFSRNLGLISPEEQERLRNSRVAIAGMGGVGGIHLVTLARLGIGKFTIADPDVYETANFNRQYGATIETLGQSKVDVMAQQALAINPDIDLRVMPEAVSSENVEEFLAGVDFLVDGVDFFCYEARRMLFRGARQRGIWASSAGPIGFGTAWLTFSPHGMSFDEYFDLHDGMDDFEKFIAFVVGLAPKATHLPYMDLKRVNLASGAGPSASLACQLAGGVMGAEVLKVLLNRGTVRPAPHYFQFDAYRLMLRRGYLWRGNRNPWQQVKRSLMRRRFRREFQLAAAGPRV